PNYLLLPHAIGALLHLQLPPGFPVGTGDVIRLQTLFIEPLNPLLFDSTNEAWFIGGQPAAGVLIEAVGPNSFKQDPARGFWRVQHLGGTAAIDSITFNWNGATMAGQETAVFDVAQEQMSDRHDGGNATAAGCHGTYRNGSDVTAGLDYGFPGNHQAPCAAGSENSGFTIDVGSPDAARALTYHFTGGTFVGGVTFEFDCDTDGGLGVSGDAMAGLYVKVVLVGGQQLIGNLAVDPFSRFRACVQL
ncbi:MAG TPA: hypothetical protein VK348_01725, partial [Planctomycetota bacterium]|nr:hypothetical protein [Planctomycetota bacterium]